MYVESLACDAPFLCCFCVRIFSTRSPQKAVFSAYAHASVQTFKLSMNMSSTVEPKSGNSFPSMDSKFSAKSVCTFMLLCKKLTWDLRRSSQYCTGEYIFLSRMTSNGTIPLQLGILTGALESIRERGSIGKVGPLPSSFECTYMVFIHSFGTEDG